MWHLRSKPQFWVALWQSSLDSLWCSYFYDYFSATTVAKSPWDSYKKWWKAIFLSTSSSLHLTRTPNSPLEQCCFVYETLEVVLQVKCSHYYLYFSQKTTLFGMRMGMKVKCRIKNCQVSQDFWRLLQHANEVQLKCGLEIANYLR